MTGHAMQRKHAINLLTQCKTKMKSRFGVTKLLLFGSTVRYTTNSDIDVDILVNFDGPANSKRYFGVLFFWEDLLGYFVDLVTEKALRPELRPYVEKEEVALLLSNLSKKGTK
jgi:predicted nucleotidyltransferase